MGIAISPRRHGAEEPSVSMTGIALRRPSALALANVLAKRSSPIGSGRHVVTASTEAVYVSAHRMRPFAIAPPGRNWIPSLSAINSDPRLRGEPTDGPAS